MVLTPFKGCRLHPVRPVLGALDGGLISSQEDSCQLGKLRSKVNSVDGVHLYLGWVMRDLVERLDLVQRAVYKSLDILGFLLLQCLEEGVCGRLPSTVWCVFPQPSCYT